jgi:hypothetical protein
MNIPVCSRYNRYIRRAPALPTPQHWKLKDVSEHNLPSIGAISSRTIITGRPLYWADDPWLPASPTRPDAHSLVIAAPSALRELNSRGDTANRSSYTRPGTDRLSASRASPQRSSARSPPRFSELQPDCSREESAGNHQKIPRPRICLLWPSCRPPSPPRAKCCLPEAIWCWIEISPVWCSALMRGFMCTLNRSRLPPALTFRKLLCALLSFAVPFGSMDID